MTQTPAQKARALAKRYATQGKPRLAEAWRLTAEDAEHVARSADAECSACGVRYPSAEGHPTLALCPRCAT